jgi:DNA polymerase-1
MAACRPYLNEEIAERKPKAILLLGSVAMKAMLNRAGITQMNGQVVEKDGQTYVCSFHPASILYDPSKEKDVKMAFDRYAQVLNGTYQDVKMPEWRAIDKSSIDEFLQDWADCTAFTFDTESAGHPDNPDVDGLMWFHPDWRTYSIAFTLDIPWEDGIQTKTWALPVKWPELMPFEFACDFMQHLVETQGKKICNAQNGKYDCLVMLKAYGCCFRQDDDMGLAHWLIDENSVHGLKPLARQYLNAPDYALSTREMKKPWTVPVRKRLEYNSCDTAYTNALTSMFKAKMDDEERWLYQKVLIPASRVLTRGERDGLYVDVEFLNNTSDQEFEKLKKAEIELNKMAGRIINWNAPAQVAEILYKDLGLKPSILTDGGAPSTSALAITYIDHPIGKLLEKYREHAKFLSTYAGYPPDDEHDHYHGGWRDYMVGDRLYLSTKIHGTVTGRFSHRIHSTPRDATIRSAINAPPGWVHFQLDLNQAELRTMAIMSRDPEMIRCFREHEDIHWRTLMEVIRVGSTNAEHYHQLMRDTARQLWTKKKLTFDEYVEMLWEAGKFDPNAVIGPVSAWKEERKKAKGVNFGFVYGQQPPGFVNFAKEKYGFEPSIQEATQFHAAYFNLYREIPRYHERQIKLARLDGFVRSMSGRKRRLPAINGNDKSLRAEAERQAINSPVQGFIGDYKSMIMVELGESFGPDEVIIKMEHHDAILGWIKEERLDDVCPELYERAENPRLAKECGLSFPIKMTVDLELGRWGQGTKWRPKNGSHKAAPRRRKITRAEEKEVRQRPRSDH